jgi:hypothetical protein
VASRTHRIPARLAWGCALLLGLGLTGCASSQDTSVSDPAGHVRFTVPGGWRPIGAAALTAELKSTIGNSGAWTAAYEAGPRQKATDFLSFGIAQPFVFADYVELSATASREMSDDGLRDILFPVTSAARQKAATQGYPLTDFRRLRDQVLTLSGGVHGVRETFDYRYGPDDATWDLDVMTDAAHTVVFLLIVHCNEACYSKYQAEITHVMSSVTATRLVQPTGPFSTLIGR